MSSSSSLSQFLALIFLTFLVGSEITRADEELMQQQCNYGDDLSTCMACLKSNPSSVGADVVGIGGIIIKCLISEIEILSQNVSSLASKYHDKPALEAFSVCHQSYAGSKRVLPIAAKYLSNRDYGRAEFYIQNTIGLPMSCLEDLQDAKILVPASVRYHTTTFAALTNADLNILQHLPPKS